MLSSVHEAVGLREEHLSKCTQIAHLSILKASLEVSSELPWSGNHLLVIKEAKAMEGRVKEEIRLIGLLEEALLAKDINKLRNAMTATSRLNPTFEPPYLSQVQTMIARLEAEMQVIHSTIIQS